MHAERGNIRIVVANVTALQRHWPILVKQKAVWLASETKGDPSDAGTTPQFGL